MSEIVNQSLQKIAKGTGIIFIGTIVGMLLGFVSRIIVVRCITQSEYGIVSLALVLLSIFATISTLGLSDGTARQIAFYRGKDDTLKIKGVMISSLQIALITSVLLSLVLFFTSNIISTNVFHSPELSSPLKIFSIAIPFFVLINIFISIFRGFDRVEPNVYFQNILRSVIYILFLAGAILLGLSFIGVIYAYLASIMLTCIAFAVYAMKKLPTSVKGKGEKNVNSVKKELLFFSLPLLAVSMFGMIMQWTDTLMLGYFKTPDVVGLYNAALPLANLIPVVLNAMVFLYIPITSRLYSQNLMSEMRRSHAILTKWIFSLTFPLFLIIFLFPETVLNILFGPRYIQAGLALQILALGMFIHIFLGPNAVLMSVGKTRFLMWTTLIGAIMNITLNIFLIPPLGIIGAAIASASTLVVIKLLNTTKLYLLFGIHPFTKNYLKPILTSVLLVFVIFTFVKSMFDGIPFWLLLMLFLLFIGGYGLSILLTKSFDTEDIMMLLAIEERLGVNLAPIKRILKRFV